MVNPDNLALKIAELADSGRVQGIADVRDDTSDRTGQRLVVVLKRDAVARVVLNNLLKHTELQTNFSANMLALVDGVPRTLTIDQFISNWVAHQIDVIQRRTRYRLARGGAKGPHPSRFGEGTRPARRSDRADPPLARCGRSAAGTDGPAGRRRGPGDRDPRHAAARSRRAPEAEDDRRPGRARAGHRRPQGHPREARAAAPDRDGRAHRDRRQVRRRPTHPDHRRPTATSRWRT